MRALEDLKQLILQQTQKIGASVSNIFGAAQRPLTALSGAERSSWVVLTASGRAFDAVDAFYAVYTTGTPSARRIETETGGVVAQHSGSDTVSMLLRGMAELQHPRSISIAVQTADQQASWLVQVDGRTVRRGVGGGEIGLYLEPGAHVIEVLGMSNLVGVQVPRDLRIASDFERVATPVWKSVSTGYVDESQGQAVVTLTWYSDARAGGWRVLRRQLSDVAEIEEVGALDAERRFTVKLEGDRTSLTTGQELNAMFDLMGIVLNAQYDESASTYVQLQLAPGRQVPSEFWAGVTATTGAFAEIARVGRTQPFGEVVYRDTAVAAAANYQYALEAWGFLDSNVWSPRSDVQMVRAGDTNAPDSIAFLAGYPKVVNRRAYVRFTTPLDADYAGVRVYHRAQHPGTATSGSSTTLVDSGANFLQTNNVADTTWRIRLVSGTGEGQDRPVSGVTATQITVAEVFDPAPASGTGYVVYKDTAILTDYGIPGGAPDQFDFEPVSTDVTIAVDQVYHFRAFDNAFNEQHDGLCASWTYSPDTDGSWTAPPVVGIRQVPSTGTNAQEDFGAPYNNTTNYAIIELSGADPAGRNSGVTIFYQTRAGTLQSMAAATAPVTEGGTPLNIDNPAGTRSRYVAIDRSVDQNWIKVYAQDAAGNRSDTFTFHVDYNDQPEIATLEARLDDTIVFDSANHQALYGHFGSGTNGVQGMVVVRGSVDDDAQGLVYWLEDPTGTDPTSAAKRHVDLSANRTFAFAFSLADGQRKNLVLEPWSGFSGGAATGVAGNQVQREFTRSPRSFVNFESKDQGGNASGKTVKALFEIAPAPAVLLSGRTAHASTSTATTLVDSGSPAWTVNQWASVGKRKFFVLVTASPPLNEPKGQLRRIVSNTASALTIDPVWAAIPHGLAYTIIDSSVLYRLEGAGNFMPTAGTAFFDRQDNGVQTLVEYYAVKDKAVDEPVKRVNVDADTIPTFASVTLSKPAASTLRVAVAGPDDDVKYWRVYRRRGEVGGATAWPTDAGSAPTTAADLRLEYLHHGPLGTSVLQYDSYASDGKHYIVVVPTNALNQDGPILTATETFSTAASLAALDVMGADNGATSTNNRISWTHPNIGEDADTHYVRIYARRVITSTGAEDMAEAQITSGTRSVDVDNTDFDNALDTNSNATGVGSYLHQGIADKRGTSSNGVERTWKYRVELRTVSPDVLVDTYYVDADPSFFEQTVGTQVTSATLELVNNGTATGNPRICGSYVQRRVTWAATNVDDANYTISIEKSTEQTPSSWTTVVDSLLPSSGSVGWLEEEFGYFEDALGPTPRWWTYRAWAVKIADGSQSGSKQQTSTETFNTSTCESV